ncbi:Centrosomin [Gryllus bimaculatus]|nr:Centrosomin [Gryllus bimaculatus]
MRAYVCVGAGGRSPPFRGRTMKEYEEMLAQLRKENFNLKLRLYFLEERGGAVGDGSGGEAGAAVRAELEQLRREAAEKQQLLCEAARAVELLEEQHHEQLRAARAAAHQAQAEAQHARAAAAERAARPPVLILLSMDQLVTINKRVNGIFMNNYILKEIMFVIPFVLFYDANHNN